MIIILDFGSQYTQLIAKKLRKLGFSAQIMAGPGRDLHSDPLLKEAKGIILSGSPWSVGEGYDPHPSTLDTPLPILGLCFGYQFLAKSFGGSVSKSLGAREYGAARISHTPSGREDPLVGNLQLDSSVWMSHGDSVDQLPAAAELILTSAGRPAGFSIPSKKIWALQFHPEVHHTPEGETIFKNFAESICGLKPDWSLKTALTLTREKLADQLKGVKEVFCGVSGGVDSTVLSVLLAEHVKVQALFVDHGFCRDYDLPDLQKTFARFPNIQLHLIDAKKEFWKELNGVSDPETKRKIAGRLFIETFYREIEKLIPNRSKSEKIFLGQGTIYSDVIESAGGPSGAAHKIKSHHNVGGLPKEIPFELVEPLRDFFKNEVREIGFLLGIPEISLNRHPFPGPGLMIRVLGKLSPERVDIVRKADAIFYNELMRRNLYSQTWQALCALLPVQTVGVKGDGRSFEEVLVLRAVSSVDGMTAEATEIPWSDLKAIANRICNEVSGVGRVVVDITSKPPATIELE